MFENWNVEFSNAIAVFMKIFEIEFSNEKFYNKIWDQFEWLICETCCLIKWGFVGTQSLKLSFQLCCG